MMPTSSSVVSVATIRVKGSEDTVGEVEKGRFLEIMIEGFLQWHKDFHY